MSKIFFLSLGCIIFIFSSDSFSQDEAYGWNLSGTKLARKNFFNNNQFIEAVVDSMISVQKEYFATKNSQYLENYLTIIDPINIDSVTKWVVKDFIGYEVRMKSIQNQRERYQDLGTKYNSIEISKRGFASDFRYDASINEFTISVKYHMKFAGIKESKEGPTVLYSDLGTKKYKFKYNELNEQIVLIGESWEQTYKRNPNENESIFSSAIEESDKHYYRKEPKPTKEFSVAEYKVSNHNEKEEHEEFVNSAQGATIKLPKVGAIEKSSNRTTITMTASQTKTDFTLERVDIQYKERQIIRKLTIVFNENMVPNTKQFTSFVNNRNPTQPSQSPQIICLYGISDYEEINESSRNYSRNAAWCRNNHSDIGRSIFGDNYPKSTQPNYPTIPNQIILTKLSELEGLNHISNGGGYKIFIKSYEKVNYNTSTTDFNIRGFHAIIDISNDSLSVDGRKIDTIRGQRTFHLEMYQDEYEKWIGQNLGFDEIVNQLNTDIRNVQD